MAGARWLCADGEIEVSGAGPVVDMIIVTVFLADRGRLKTHG